MASIEGIGPDAPVVVNAAGGKQSAAPTRCDLLPPVALIGVAKVLKHGADKYGDNNWRNIPVADHLNHAMTHLFAHLSGDTQDAHLEHFACRALFALELHRVNAAKGGSAATRSGRLRVYVAGPITKGDIGANISQAATAGLRLLKAGLAPLVPHLTCYMGEASSPDLAMLARPEALPCGTKPADWYAADMPWVDAADVVLRLPGESVGADLEVRRAAERGIPVFQDVNEVIAWSQQTRS